MPFVVKVQIAITGNATGPQVLIYNQDRSLQHQTPLSPKLDMLMRQEFQEDGNSYYKAFFFAHLEGGEIVLGAEAPFMAW